MRVLLIAWYFPPYNDVGALRSAAFARYLDSHGHDVQVLSAERGTADTSLPIPIDPKRVTNTPMFDVDTWTTIRGDRNSLPTPPAPRSNDVPPPRRSALRSALGVHYRSLTRQPDRQIGWLPYFVRFGAQILARDPFDLIYASGPPFTAFLGARTLSRRFSVPWFAEYRDAWSDDIYGERPRWRRAVDRWLENRTLASATGIVAVSGIWADHFSRRFQKPTIGVFNGYDGDLMTAARSRQSSADEPLSIVYSGILYGGLRDPSCLYKALVLSELTPADVQILYYGPAPSDVFPLAEKFGVTDFVKVKERVPYATSLAVQRQSDILLLLQPPGDEGNVPAKFFEYVAAQRPILGLGLDDGMPAQIIRERGAGFYLSDPMELAKQLRLWVSEKRQTGKVADLPPSVRVGLSRTEQIEKLVGFLQSNIHGRATTKS